MKKLKWLKVAVWAAISVILIAAFIVGNVIANKWETPLTGFFGSVGGSKGVSEDALFVPDDTTQDDIDATAARISSQIVREGTVLLKNDNALPLSSGDKVSVFGVTSAYWMTGEKPVSTTNGAFTKALEEAGISINTSLRSLYKSNAPKYGTGSSMGDGTSFNDWSVDELEMSKYTDSIKQTFSQFNDAAIVVLSRGGSEGGDVPMWMDAQGGEYGQSYMSLSSEEKELLAMVTGAFDNVIVILHSANAMDMDFLADYDIDGVIWVAGTGDVQLTALGDLITGKCDFSGRLVDTYLTDNMEYNPAVQNFGDFRYTDQNGNLLEYSYVNYAEGIYVGYKYYETRYEDSVTGAYDAGDFNYDEAVAYPFGYGLSYNTYSWSQPVVSSPDEEGNITLTLSVTNNGDLPGKDVVEIYYQSPFTQDDIDNGIEKAAVNLIAFAKTDEIQPGGSYDVEVTFNLGDMASWDSNYAHDGGTGAYRIDGGDWYITAAADAHSAVNNILAVKEQDFTDGDPSLVHTMTIDETRFITEATTGNAYKNNFADATLSDANYLSRTNWSAVEDGSLIYQDGSKTGVSNVMAADGKVYTHTASAETLSALSASGWDAAGNPHSATDGSAFPSFTTGAENGLTLSDMTGLEYEDEKWEQLLDMLTLEQMNTLYGNGGYGTPAIDSIGKPLTKEYDGPARILNLFSGETSYVYPAEVMLAATWNTHLAEDMGSNIGDQCLLDGISGWYAPAMNIHRTAFCGRNFEYYSEDGVLSGIMAAAETVGVQNKGVYVYLKHFVLNDQETNRGANGRYAAFGTEQSIREIYLKPFQIAVEDADARGVMASMNRIGHRWAVVNYDLLTGTLRNEWGFKGIVVTDYISGMSAEDIEAGIAAGLDLQLITSSNPLSESSMRLAGVQSALRESAHRILYVQANSLAMNEYDFGFAIYKLLLIALGFVLAAYIAWSGYLVIKYSFFVKGEEGGKVRLKKWEAVTSIVAAVVLAVLIVFVLVWFFTIALPALKQAFTL